MPAACTTVALKIKTVPTKHSHGPEFLRPRIRPDLGSERQRTEPFSKIADQTEGVATRLAEGWPLLR